MIGLGSNKDIPVVIGLKNVNANGQKLCTCGGYFCSATADRIYNLEQSLGWNPPDLIIAMFNPRDGWLVKRSFISPLCWESNLMVSLSVERFSQFSNVIRCFLSLLSNVIHLHNISYNFLGMFVCEIVLIHKHLEIWDCLFKKAESEWSWIISLEAKVDMRLFSEASN